MKTFKVLFAFMFAVSIAIPALAFQGFNGDKEIGLFNKIKCGTGITCSKEKDKFSVVLDDELTGVKSPIVAATATTAKANQCGSTFVSSGAVEMELPDASTVLGCTYTFVAGTASVFTIDPDNADVIVYDDATAGDALKSSGTIGETITIRAGSGSQWFVIGVNGTWAADN